MIVLKIKSVEWKWHIQANKQTFYLKYIDKKYYNFWEILKKFVNVHKTDLINYRKVKY